MRWGLIIVVGLFLFTIIRTRARGFFWKDRAGKELSFKEFMGRWKSGVEGITPLQQTKTTLWSYPLVLGGILVGIIIMVLRREFWLVLILSGSLPMTLMGLLSTFQKFLKLKKIDKVMKELNKPKKKRKRRKKK